MFSNRLGLFFVGCLVFFSACDTEKNHELDRNLFGSWGWVDRTTYVGTQDTVAYYETPAVTGCGERFDLNSNGNYYWTYENCVDPDEEGDESGSWYVTDNHSVIHFIEGTGDHGRESYEFHGDTLVLIQSDMDDGELYMTVSNWLLK